MNSADSSHSTQCLSLEHAQQFRKQNCLIKNDTKKRVHFKKPWLKSFFFFFCSRIGFHSPSCTMIQQGRRFGKRPLPPETLTRQRALVGLHGRTAKPLSIRPEAFVCGGADAFSVTALPPPPFGRSCYWKHWRHALPLAERRDARWSIKANDSPLAQYG